MRLLRPYRDSLIKIVETREYLGRMRHYSGESIANYILEKLHLPHRPVMEFIFSPVNYKRLIGLDPNTLLIVDCVKEPAKEMQKLFFGEFAQHIHVRFSYRDKPTGIEILTGMLKSGDNL
jgi:hypothetical protein